jgi:iron complex transport system substrate-binding protein|tara:strand:+ start:20 stop:805 length:786 start_codon:yes stop_codon:yes gene_type:complete
MQKFPPERIVCLSGETIETIYLLGEEKRIVGVTGFASRPKIVRIEKARVSSFTEARTNEILRLNPDLVFTFSDVQADLSRDLILAGLNVFCFNQRSVTGIFSMISMIGAILNCTDKAINLQAEFMKKITFCKENKLNYQPKVYFEEWNEPMIAGIGWVSEIISIAGGIDIFADKASHPKSKDRTVFLDEVIEENPDIILASWCGKKVDVETIYNRKGWDAITAIRNKKVFVLNASEILQPGPAALTDGLTSVRNIIVNCSN